MLPPACTLCGSPLPAVPVDPAHPEWCATCAARAIGAPGPTSAVPVQVGTWAATASMKSGDLVVRARIPDGIVIGIAFAAIGGGIWWGVAASTQKLFPYLALLVGLLAGQGVLIGARRGGVVQAVLAGVFCLVALAAAQYFVLRSVAIHDNPGIEIPLWQGLTVAREVVTESITENAVTAACFALAVITAVASVAVPNRRPIV